MSQPKKDPFLPEDKQPLMECHTCGHFKAEQVDGSFDWAKGSCSHTGMSTVPPRHVCEAWCQRKRNKR